MVFDSLEKGVPPQSRSTPSILISPLLARYMGMSAQAVLAHTVSAVRDPMVAASRLGRMVRDHSAPWKRMERSAKWWAAAG